MHYSIRCTLSVLPPPFITDPSFEILVCDIYIYMYLYVFMFCIINPHLNQYYNKISSGAIYKKYTTSPPLYRFPFNYYSLIQTLCKIKALSPLLFFSSQGPTMLSVIHSPAYTVRNQSNPQLQMLTCSSPVYVQSFNSRPALRTFSAGATASANPHLTAI